MDNIVIKVENLSKQYRLGSVGTGSLAHDITKTWYSLRGKENPFLKIGETNDRAVKGLTEYVWALQDINFDVKQGEVLGIIGRNGAGKSTLLKILSRTTTPTTGSIKVKGRIASLLEVGTGFHPELSGKENIYLNGTILGMTKKQIDRKFDEIVAFSGVERYIDTPVKRYSSGMYVRLAFAVAAHLDPEILIVDEVLAVGDAEFQRRCLGKLEDVSKEGRTVILVSHNMAAITSLCTRVHLIEKGQLRFSGNPDDAVKKYLEGSAIHHNESVTIADRKDRYGDGSVRIISIDIKNDFGDTVIRCGDSLLIKMDYVASANLRGANFLVRICDELNSAITFLDSDMAGGITGVLPSSGTVICRTAPINITPGLCIINIAIMVNGTIADQVKYASSFNVDVNDIFGTGKMMERKDGTCVIGQQWSIEANV